MTAEDKSISITDVSDGNVAGILKSVTIPDGEVWYIERFVGASDGGGGTDNFVNYKFGVGNTAFLDAFIDDSQFPSNSDIGALHAPSTDTASVDETAIDKYAASGDEIRIEETADDDSTGGNTAELKVIARRVV